MWNSGLITGGERLGVALRTAYSNGQASSNAEKQIPHRKAWFGMTRKLGIHPIPSGKMPQAPHSPDAVS
jgi:hypothetical protein